MSALHPCPACSRHVRATEATCPFCASALPAAPPPRRAPPRRLGRAAVFAFGGAALAQAAGCYDHHVRGAPVEPPTRRDAGMEASVGLLYGTPPDPEPLDAGLLPVEDAGADVGSVHAMYGGPTPIEPADAGLDAGESVVPAYGGPWPFPEPDAGHDAGAGAPMNLYGAPPEP